MTLIEPAVMLAPVFIKSDPLPLASSKVVRLNGWLLPDWFAPTILSDNGVRILTLPPDENAVKDRRFEGELSRRSVVPAASAVMFPVALRDIVGLEIAVLALVLVSMLPLAWSV